MPSPLHEDAIAFLRQRGVPLSADGLNRAMNILAANGQLRPSYGGSPEMGGPMNDQVSVEALPPPTPRPDAVSVSPLPPPVQDFTPTVGMDPIAEQALQQDVAAEARHMRGGERLPPQKPQMQAQTAPQPQQATQVAEKESKDDDDPYNIGPTALAAGAAVGGGLGFHALRKHLQSQGNDQWVRANYAKMAESILGQGAAPDPSYQRVIQQLTTALRSGDLETAEAVAQNLLPEDQKALGRIFNNPPEALGRGPSTAKRAVDAGGRVVRALATRGRSR